jgi:CheY-like chemotaxis protein
MIGLILDATAVPHEDVGDGVAALEHLARHEYGTVLLDLMMPGMDGFAVLRSLAETRPEFLGRVIVLTGGTPELIARVDANVFGVLRKPVVLRELLDAVHRCLEQPSH